MESARDWKEPPEEGHQEREDYTSNGWNSRFTNSAAITGALVSDERQWSRPATDRDLLQSASSSLQYFNSRTKISKIRHGRLCPNTPELIRASRSCTTNVQRNYSFRRRAPQLYTRHFIHDKRI
jgi:hypothetical protein